MRCTCRINPASSPRQTYLALIGLLASSPIALGDELVIDAYLTGGYQASGAFANSPAFQNYRVGHSPITTDPERRNFFLFDLSAYPALPPGTITAASLKLYVPFFAPGVTIDPGDGYISPDPFEVYRLSATPFAADEIADPTNSVGEALAIYSTLGTGPLAGEVAISPADKGTFADIPLTPGAVMAINTFMGSGKIAMGGRVTTLSFIPPDELLFGFTDLIGPHMSGKTPHLSLTVVPGPSGAALLAGASLVVVRRRRMPGIRAAL